MEVLPKDLPKVLLKVLGKVLPKVSVKVLLKVLPKDLGGDPPARRGYIRLKRRPLRLRIPV